MTPRLQGANDPSPDQKRALLAKLMEKQGGAKRIAPMSFAQQRLWLLHQITPDHSLYNMANTLRLGMTLDHDIFRRCLEEIVRRHEILRTTFGAADRALVQIIGPAPAVDVPVVDLSGLERDARDGEAERIAAEDYVAPFDLRRLPLFRTRLLRFADDDYVFVLTMHHIICDGWSLGVFFGELWSLYGAYMAGLPSPLPKLPIQYADFAVWQRDLLTGEVRDRQLSYWKQQLAGLRSLELPADRVRPAIPSFRGNAVTINLNSDLLPQLRTLATQQNATLFMVLLAAFQVLIYRYSGEPDVAIGSPVAGRNNGQTEALIGFFVNSLVMRTSLAGDPTFREAVDRVRETALAAYANQDLPFEMLVEELQPERALGRNPLFQVIFQLLPMADANAVGEDGRPLAPPVRTQTAKFDISLTLYDSGNRLTGWLEYACDLFDEDRMRRMGGHYTTLVESIAVDPGQPISSLDLLKADERRQLLNDWIAAPTLLRADGGALEAFERAAAGHGDSLAISDGATGISYGDLDRHANGVAVKLREQGAGRGTIVAIAIPPSPRRIVAALGALKAGAAYLPIDPSSPRERLDLILTRSRAVASITPEFFEAIEPCAAVPPLPYDADAIAYVIYTSGSTGEPKGVEIPHRGLANLIKWHNRTFNVSADSRASQFAAFGFDAAVWEIWPYLAAGACVEIVPDEVRYAPSRLPEWIAQRGITHCFVPTPMLDSVVRQPWPSTSLRFLLTGGDRLARGVPTGLAFRVFNQYGPTENSVVTTSGVVPEDRGDGVVPSIGRAISNVELLVVDRNCQLVPIGIPGELWIGGAGIARGYLDAPEQTAERFVTHPLRPGRRFYRSGDLVRYTAAGDLEFLGRLDRQAKIRGFRIELGEIEAVLGGVPGVTGICAVVREDTPGEQRLAAYVTGAPDAAQLRARAKETLPDYMVPSAFVALDALPLTSNGKVDRDSLPRPPRAPETSPYAPPQTRIERTICATWAEELHCERVGIDENFFELGGNSLSLVRVHLRLEQSLKQTIPVVELFRYPTVRTLAVFLGAHERRQSVVDKARERAARRREARP